MLFDFFNYLNNNHLDDYLNCYSTFLISQKDLKNNLLKIRMNVLIDTYLKNEKKNKFDYYYYYLSNFKDRFMEKPLLTFDKIHEFKDEFEGFDDDVKDHYHFITTKKEKEPEPDYEEIDKKFYEEEMEKDEELIEDLDYDSYDYDNEEYDSGYDYNDGYDEDVEYY